MAARQRNRTVVVGLIILSTWLVPTAAASAATKGHSSGVTFRAVLCFAPLAPAKPKFSQSAALPECRPKFRLTAQNLGVKPDNAAAGFTSKNVAPDSRFLEFPDSASTGSSLTSNELLPGIKGSRTERYVLGPALVTSSAIKSAKAVKESLGQWVVTYQLTTAGNVAFNALAKSQFHALVAIVANGEVYSAPLMQPTQTHFTTFGGSGEISGSFTEAQAKYLAQQMVASKP